MSRALRVLVPAVALACALPAAASEVEAFTRVEVRGPLDVRIDKGEEHTVVIVGAHEGTSTIETEVKDGVLKLKTQGAIWAHVRVTTPSLESVSHHGRGTLRVKDVDAHTFSVSVHGAGSVEVSGRAASVSVSVGGAGGANLKALVAEQASVASKGTGIVQIHSTRALQVSISGTGDVVFYGKPGSVQQQVMGAGELRAGVD